MARTFWVEPAKRGRVAGVSATPNAQPIAFQQVVPEYFWTFIRLSRVKKLLALLLALGVCEVVTPCPRPTWSWRRGSESNVNSPFFRARVAPTQVLIEQPDPQFFPVIYPQNSNCKSIFKLFPHYPQTISSPLFHYPSNIHLLELLLEVKSCLVQFRL